VHKPIATRPYCNALTYPQPLGAQTFIQIDDVLHFDTVATSDMTERFPTADYMLGSFSRAALRRDHQFLSNANRIARQFVPFTQLVDGAIKALREHAERVALLHSPHLPLGRNAHG